MSTDADRCNPASICVYLWFHVFSAKSVAAGTGLGCTFGLWRDWGTCVVPAVEPEPFEAGEHAAGLVGNGTRVHACHLIRTVCRLAMVT